MGRIKKKGPPAEGATKRQANTQTGKANARKIQGGGGVIKAGKKKKKAAAGGPVQTGVRVPVMHIAH